jgi:hypothetical protein
MLTAAHTEFDLFRSLLLTAKVRVPAFALSLAKGPVLDTRCRRNHLECSYYLNDINIIDLFAILCVIVKYGGDEKTEQS